MRMAALSRASGVPVPTIKFYLREGLLPAGRRTSPNQSQYDDDHVRRLALIRSLTELGGCSLATVAEVVRTSGDDDASTAQVAAILSRTVTEKLTDRPVDGVQPRFQLVDAVMREHGWRLTDNDEHRLTAATLLGIMQRLDVPHTPSSLRAYAAAASLTADAEPGREGDRDAERAVLATVLDDALLASLRRMAQVSAADGSTTRRQPAVIQRKP
jgi:DNA-binding transcriptional MerR regulator